MVKKIQKIITGRSSGRDKITGIQLAFWIVDLQIKPPLLLEQMRLLRVKFKTQFGYRLRTKGTINLDRESYLDLDLVTGQDMSWLKFSLAENKVA